MNISVRKLTDESLMRRACEMTFRGTSNMTLKEIYRLEHSPARTQIFWIEMLGIPTFVSVHLVRHKHGVEHFVLSNREDRGGVKADRDTPINHGMLVNAQELIYMARKRLCGQSASKTREVMEEIRREVGKVDPALALAMVRECVYRNGYCPETKPCSLFNQK